MFTTLLYRAFPETVNYLRNVVKNVVGARQASTAPVHAADRLRQLCSQTIAAMATGKIDS